jgi:DNA-binding XRE family transcriptional regulator
MYSRKLKAFMNIHKLSCAEVGRSIGVTRQAVWYWKKKGVPRCWHKVLERYFTEVAMSRIVKGVDK